MSRFGPSTSNDFNYLIENNENSDGFNDLIEEDQDHSMEVINLQEEVDETEEAVSADQVADEVRDDLFVDVKKLQTDNFQRLVLEKLSMLLVEELDVKRLQKEQKSDINIDLETITIKTSIFPLRTVAGFLELEETLKTDMEYKRQLTTYLKTIGGNSITDNLKRITKGLFMDEVLVGLTWGGTHQKDRLSNKEISSLILVALCYSLTKATSSSLKSFYGVYLRNDKARIAARSAKNN
ncbi:hypothetical protein ACFFRR_008504 [Megaselia abdita]